MHFGTRSAAASVNLSTPLLYQVSVGLGMMVDTTKAMHKLGTRQEQIIFVVPRDLCVRVFYNVFANLWCILGCLRYFTV